MTNRTAKRRRLLEDLFGSKLDEEDKDKEEFNDFLEYADDRPQIRAQQRPNKERDHQGGHEKLMTVQGSGICRAFRRLPRHFANLPTASSSFKTSSPSSSSSPRSKTSSSSSSSSPSSKPSSPSSKPSSPSSKPSSPSSKPSSPSSKPSSPFLFDSRTHPVSKYL
ncbi:hypothetical protein PCANC_18800 [Puccinia coronata f. sp. avenae]|uniref:Uncharacterized protein n=1 Tax=Puccinia coronata f. sp. avenae TaxID=200324 RepID=A0A2N5SG82_9BASI|nr:hypothetical protein PCANC_18800 [Puccinia coronata f. sp. avenae]